MAVNQLEGHLPSRHRVRAFCVSSVIPSPLIALCMNSACCLLNVRLPDLQENSSLQALQFLSQCPGLAYSTKIISIILTIPVLPVG
jgi:hypothetical protein